MGAVAAEVDTAMAAWLGGGDGPDAPVWAAMRHGCLGGGKRLRPFLVLNTAALFNVPRTRAVQTAAAVEFVHCYSLIHDDLPAMDDAALRRGRPTVHRAFDDATAILAGDGLLTLAFAVLGQPVTHPDAAVRVGLVSALADAAGVDGMVGGQMMDMVAEARYFALPEVERLQRLKTGALITFACVAGAILGGAPADRRSALETYAANLGVAFQIADDLLDVTGSEADVGKTVGHDADAGKATFVSHLGVDGARREADRFADGAISALHDFGAAADSLRAIARFTVERTA